jgi:putative transcriptional regulator
MQPIDGFTPRQPPRYSSPMKIDRPGPRRASAEGYLDGQLLIAMPVMSDPRFARSVIYLCAHSEDGAMGLIINQRASHISFPDLLERLGIETEDAQDGIAEATGSMSIHVGGPVETGRGFVLHSSDYFAEDSTLTIEDGVCLTATIDILKAIAAGNGPDRAILALGYAGWSPGQLETEIQANGWLNCPADPDLIFDKNLEAKYTRALAKIGIDPSHLVSDAGHA